MAFTLEGSQGFIKLVWLNPELWGPTQQSSISQSPVLLTSSPSMLSTLKWLCTSDQPVFTPWSWSRSSYFFWTRKVSNCRSAHWLKFLRKTPAFRLLSTCQFRRQLRSAARQNCTYICVLRTILREIRTISSSCLTEGWIHNCECFVLPTLKWTNYIPRYYACYCLYWRNYCTWSGLSDSHKVEISLKRNSENSASAWFFFLISSF